MVTHPFEPVCNRNSRILILGTMPSVQSRRQGFYYGNPQNRFWQVLAALLESPVPSDVDGRKQYLLEHQIAVWDVLAQCNIKGSQDSSISDPVVNNISGLLNEYPIQVIFANGQAAARLYHRLCEKETGRPCVALPSTSPANAACSLVSLVDKWTVVREALQPL